MIVPCSMEPVLIVFVNSGLLLTDTANRMSSDPLINTSVGRSVTPFALAIPSTSPVSAFDIVAVD